MYYSICHFLCWHVWAWGGKQGDDGVSGSSPAGRTLKCRVRVLLLACLLWLPGTSRNSGCKDLGVNKDPKLCDHCGTDGKQGWGSDVLVCAPRDSTTLETSVLPVQDMSKQEWVGSLICNPRGVTPMLTWGLTYVSTWTHPNPSMGDSRQAFYCQAMMPCSGPCSSNHSMYWTGGNHFINTQAGACLSSVRKGRHWVTSLGSAQACHKSDWIHLALQKTQITF